MDHLQHVRPHLPVHPVRRKTFVSYPLPTRVTWLRDLVFAKDGGICSSSSNLPAYGIEGGRASFICLYPEGETAAN